MNKTTLVAQVAKRTGMEKPEVARVVDEVLDAVRSSVAKGERVTLAGFGTFERRRRNARVGRNPHTGEPVKVPARPLPTFRPGKAFREAVMPRKRASRRKKTPARRSRR